MLEMVAVGVALFALVAAAGVFGPRIGVADPLLLVMVGLLISLIPVVPDFVVEPDLVLEVLLPPLLYAAAVSLPPMSMRREFTAISGLSVVLVIFTAVALGLVFAWLIPGVGFAWGAALGAIISPTDAAATAIVKKAGVPSRAIVILEGEALLNDATALVLLRTAVASALGTFSVWAAVGTFAYSVAVAAAIGGIVGVVTLWVRARIEEPTIATIVSFTVPFLASIPAELLDAPGLVAAVVAGLVTSLRGAGRLPPLHRLSDRQNWASVQRLLEGLVFVTMGLQLPTVIEDVATGDFGVSIALAVSVLALVIALGVRAAYVLPLLWQLQRRVRLGQARAESLDRMKDKVDAAGESGEPLVLTQEDRSVPVRPSPARPGGRREEEGPRTPPWTQRREERRRTRSRTLGGEEIARFGRRIRRAIADLDYFMRQPLGRREGLVVVWAGMRGAVTVATAQTLPTETPHRPLLVFIAFAVATISLLGQGLTVGPLAARLYRDDPDEPDSEQRVAERQQVAEVLRAAVDAHAGEEAVDVIKAQRAALLRARSELAVDGEVLDTALRRLDASQIEWEIRRGKAV